MKIIPVNSPKHGYHEILVDDEDFDLVTKYKWSIRKNRNTFYATKTLYINGKYKNLQMHRLILGITDPKILVDHENHNGLNCQKYNIRVCTRSQNNSNSSSRKNSTSQYLGVCLLVRKRTLKTGKIATYYCWAAQIRINKRQTRLGLFQNEIDAAKCYDKYAKIHHKEFANLNFK